MMVRALHESGRNDVEIVAINDLNSAEANAHFLRYDTVHGRFRGQIAVGPHSTINIGRGEIAVFQEREPHNLPWKALEVDIVVEATGMFTQREKANKHLEAGAKRVLVAAPASGADYTVVFGVNDEGLRHDHLTTVHAYTADQSLQDGTHKDLRRARAAAASLIPTTTGAARSIGLVLPQLAGRLQGTSIRVPTADVCLIDLEIDSQRPTSVDALNSAFVEWSQNGLHSVLDATDEPLVSSDFIHHPASAIVDLTETCVIDERFIRVLAWYDNEWGFSNRLLDSAARIGALG
jgi:glyceraldehyde 3-phosphate dehydrogenase